MSLRHELRFIDGNASYPCCKNQDCNSASRANLVNAPTRGQVLTCIIDLCKVWACFCLDLKFLFVTSFISSIMSYPCCKNQDCISASRANLVNAPTRGQVLTCIIDLCKVWACFCLDLKCLFVTSFISSMMASYPYVARTKIATQQVGRILLTLQGGGRC